MFRFEVNFWDEDTSEPTFEKGIVAGKDYGEATNRVIEFYGKSNVVDIKIYEITDILVDSEIKDFSTEES